MKTSSMEQLFEKIKALRKSGKPTIGCFPLYPPLELFHAMGLTPVVLWGFKEYISDFSNSDKYVQNYACSVARSLTEFIFSGGWECLDYLFMYNACDTLRNLPEILEFGLLDYRRTGRKIFKAHFPMVPPEQTNSNPYFRNEISNLIDELESALDKPFSLNRFEESVELYREARELTLKVEELVSNGSLSFKEFSKYAWNIFFDDVEKQIEILRTILSNEKSDKVNDDSKRIILSGILHPPDAISETIENAGMRIVGNDIATLYRSYYYTPELKAPEDFYVDLFQNRFPCTTVLYSADRRLKALIDMIREQGALGFIFIGEIPYIENRLKEEGVKTLFLEIAGEGYDSISSFETRIEAFSEMLKP